MLFTINSELLKRAVRKHLAKKYRIDISAITYLDFNEGSLISGIFTDKPFGENQSRPLLEVRLKINDIDFIETISNESYLFTVAKTLISEELGLNESDFILEEIYPSENKENGDLVVVHFYLNGDEE
jgi:hypothetical protein